MIRCAKAVLVTFSALALFAFNAAADSPPEKSPAKRPKVALFVSVTAPGGVAASFGDGGTDEISVLALLAKALGEREFTVVSVAGQKVTTVATGEGARSGLLADESAADVARRVGASVALIVSFEGVSDGKIRGTSLSGAVSRGGARLLDVDSGRVVAERSASGAGWGEDIGAAVERSFRDATREFAIALVDAASKAWPLSAPSTAGRVRVAIRGARGWGSVGAIIRRLATTDGISAVHPESVSGGDVVLALETSLGKGPILSAIRGARLVTGSLTAQSTDAGITVSVSGD